MSEPAITDTGKADWMYDDEYDMHIPCCSQPKGAWRCGNGPLEGTAILTGHCGEDHGRSIRQQEMELARSYGVRPRVPSSHDGMTLADECVEPGDVVCPRLGNCTDCAGEYGSDRA